MTTSSEDKSIRAQVEIGEHTLRIVARDFHKARTGVSAEVNVLINQRLLAYDTFNLSKLDERVRLARSAHAQLKNGLGDAYDQESCKHDIDLFCKLARKAWEELPEIRGQPVTSLKVGDAVKAPTWLLKPLLHRGQPTILYADGGTGKSILAELIGLIVARGWMPNPLKMVTERTNVLYLDWETNQDEIQWRMEAMAKGMNIPEGPALEYKECRRPLAEDIDSIADVVLARGIGLVIVDSIGGAIGGDLRENEAANLYFGALRRLGVASLSLTHIAKADRDSKEATAFGTVYFRNWARLAWEMKQSPEAEDDSIVAGLYHRKSNNTKKFAPIGVRLDFFNDGDSLKEIQVGRIEISDDPHLSKSLSLNARISTLLKRGLKSAEDIIGETEAKPATVYAELSRMSKKGLIVKVGAHWALAAKESDALPF